MSQLRIRHTRPAVTYLNLHRQSLESGTDSLNVSIKINLTSTSYQNKWHNNCLRLCTVVFFYLDMSVFHEHFKDEFRKIWNDVSDVDLDEEGSLEEFLDQAEALYTQLSAHHGIEVCVVATGGITQRLNGLAHVIPSSGHLTQVGALHVPRSRKAYATV